MAPVGSQTRNAALLDIVKKLQYIRVNSAVNTIIKIENSEYIVKVVGCNAYWFLPAVAERPIMAGLPNASLCPHLGIGLYGLSDYKQSEKKHYSKDIKVLSVNVKNK